MTELNFNQTQRMNKMTTKKNIVRLLHHNNIKEDANYNAFDFNKYYTAVRKLKRSKRSWKEFLVIAGFVESINDLIHLGKEWLDKLVLGARHQITTTTPELQILEESIKNRQNIEELQKVIKNRLNSAEVIAKDYWAITKNVHDLVLGNQSLLLLSQGLLLANTGLLIGVAFMMMNINSKLDRNYEAILRLEAKVERNYEAILRLENKVDRNLEVMLSRFKILEHNLTNAIERGFKEVIDFVRQTRIEAVTSELITFIKHFIQEKNTIKNLTRNQYFTKVDEVNGILQRLQNSRMPQSGSLHTLLHNIINQKFAVPENSNDKLAFTALGLLCSGTEIYFSVMSFLLEEYGFLAHFYYQQNDLEKYNHYFSLVSTTFNDFKNSLSGENGLIDEVIHVLNEARSHDFIKDERVDVVEFASRKIEKFNLIKSKIASVNTLSQDISTEKIKYSFSNSQVSTPIGNWEDQRKVKYAIQFQSNGTTYPVGEWSTPARVHKKANPFLDIGTDPNGRTRLIFRMFDNDRPELVGIVEDGNQREFRDIDRDLYNAILEPNEDIANEEMKIFLANGADISARYERGRQPIHAAVESGHFSFVVDLINKGADINASDVIGYAPIHIAADVGHEDFIKELVAKGANIHAKTKFGKTALHIAAEKGHVHTVTNLMQIENTDINAKDHKGFTPLHTASSFGNTNVILSLSQNNKTDINAQSNVRFTPLHIAVIGEYGDAVEALLKNNRIKVNAQTKSGLTALHLVSLTGNLKIAKSIIEHDAVNVNEKSIDGWTALHLAINSKQENIAIELLSTVNIEINAKGKDDLTPLHLAASNSQMNIVLNLLNKGAFIDDLDKYGCTPLHFSIESGDLVVVKCLAEKGANLYAERKDGYTPLGLAACNGKLNIVQYLVNNKRVNVNAQNKNGMTPIDFAASKGFFDIVEFFIDNGANKESALHWAAYGGQLDIVKYLANEKTFELNKTDNYGNIPLHIASLQGHLNVIKFFVDEKGVDINAKNNDGYTPFLFAALGNKLSVIKYFIDEKNVDFDSTPNNSDSNGSTALHLSALNSNLGVVKYLIRKGVNVHAVDNYGNTCLFLAVSRGHLDMVKYLIQKGANFQIANNFGNTPLHFAAWNDHLDIVKELFEMGVNLNATNENGETPLHVSVSVEVAKYLSEKGANLKALSKDGFTPFHAAAANGNLDIVNLFLEQGVNIHIRVIRSRDGNDNGKTALHLAAENGRLDLVDYLIKKGADVFSQDDRGQMAYILAYQNKHSNVVKLLEQALINVAFLNAVLRGHLHMVETYFDLGASLGIRDKYGNTLQEVAYMNSHTEIADFLNQKELDSNLIYAVKQGNLDKIRECIARGASLEAKDKDGHSLSELASQDYEIEQLLAQALLNLDLMNAARKGDIDRIMNIAREVNLNIKDKNDNSLLHLALFSGHLGTVRYLCESGADFNAVNKDKSYPLHIAATNGALDAIKYLIDAKGANFEVKDKNGNTPLILAALAGHLNTVKYLVDKGANVNIADDKGNTSLHEAATLDIVKCLIQNGANISAVNANGFSVLQAAAFNGKLDIIKFLVEEKEMNIDVKDRNNTSPLALAAQNGHILTVKYLVGKGAQEPALAGYLEAVKSLIDERTVEAQDNEGNTSLHSAAAEGYLGIVKYLLLNKADLHSKNRNGRTPLHVAAEKGCLDVVKYLVEKGAGLVADNQDANPLHLAAGSDKLNVVKYFVEKGANVHARMITNNDGSTALHLAAKNGHLNMVKYLVMEGTYIDATDKRGVTPLCYAAGNGYLDIVEFLIDNKADVNTITGDIGGPLHFAAEKGNLDIVKYLFEKGSFINGTDIYDNTPLHLAAQQGELDVVAFLIEKKANVNADDYNFNTPMHLAAKNGHLEVVRYLVKNNASINNPNKQGITPLAYAGLNDHINLVKYFIEEQNIDYNNIFDAAKNGYLGIVKYFIEKGANIHNVIRDPDVKMTPIGLTAEHLKINKNRIDDWIDEQMGFTLRFMFGGSQGSARTAFKEGCPITILQSAAVRGHLNVVQYLLEEKGMDANYSVSFSRYCVGLSLQVLAALYGKLNILKYLIENGYVDIKERTYFELLFYAVRRGHLDVVQYILEESGIDVSKDSPESYLNFEILHAAIDSRNLDLVKYIVSKGANLNLKNREGKNPLDYAKSCDFDDIATFLESKAAHRSRRSIDDNSVAIRKYMVINSESKRFPWMNFFANRITYTANYVTSSYFKPVIDAGQVEPSKQLAVQSIDTNSTLFMLNVFLREITGEKFISKADQPVVPIEARGYALSIVEEFKTAVQQAALKSGISMHRILINWVEIQDEITKLVMRGHFDKISEILCSYVAKACPGKDAGCPGKLNQKKFDKFMAELNKGLGTIK